MFHRDGAASGSALRNPSGFNPHRSRRRASVAAIAFAVLASACAETVIQPDLPDERNDGVGSGRDPDAGSGGSTAARGLCGLDFSFGDDAFDACVEGRCCGELSRCAAGDPGACTACMFGGGGGERCDALLSCVDPCVGSPVCDSRVMLVDAQRADCLSVHCCSAFSACTRSGADLDACLACLDAGGGPGTICEGAIACEARNCLGP
jgi:hypothetical protein